MWQTEFQTNQTQITWQNKNETWFDERARTKNDNDNSNTIIKWIIEHASKEKKITNIIAINIIIIPMSLSRVLWKR